eukprot:1137271-Pleurochrysis_carterae.AAC.1
MRYYVVRKSLTSSRKTSKCCCISALALCALDKPNCSSFPSENSQLNTSYAHHMKLGPLSLLNDSCKAVLTDELGACGCKQGGAAIILSGLKTSRFLPLNVSEFTLCAMSSGMIAPRLPDDLSSWSMLIDPPAARGAETTFSYLQSKGRAREGLQF